MGSASEAAQRGISAETLLTFVTGAVLGYAVRAIGWAGSKVGGSRLLCPWGGLYSGWPFVPTVQQGLLSAIIRQHTVHPCLHSS